MVKKEYSTQFHTKKGIILCLLIAFFGLTNTATSFAQICLVVEETDSDNDGTVDNKLTFTSTYDANGNQLTSVLENDNNNNGMVDNKQTVTNTICSIPVAIVPIPTIESISIFPNPFNHQFQIELQTRDLVELQFQIFNLTGKNLLQTEQIVNHSATVNMNTTDLIQGVYFLKITSEGKQLIKKLVKF
jgi:hypothetical protein